LITIGKGLADLPHLAGASIGQKSWLVISEDEAAGFYGHAVA
jgi:hypothetical protein